MVVDVVVADPSDETAVDANAGDKLGMPSNELPTATDAPPAADDATEVTPCAVSSATEAHSAGGDTCGGGPSSDAEEDGRLLYGGDGGIDSAGGPGGCFAAVRGAVVVGVPSLGITSVTQKRWNSSSETAFESSPSIDWNIVSKALREPSS